MAKPPRKKGEIFDKRRVRQPREGWSEAIAKEHASGGFDEVFWAENMQNDFDDTEWTW